MLDHNFGFVLSIIIVPGERCETAREMHKTNFLYQLQYHR